MAGKGDLPRPTDQTLWNNAPYWKALDERKKAKANQQSNLQVPSGEEEDPKGTETAGAEG